MREVVLTLKENSYIYSNPELVVTVTAEQIYPNEANYEIHTFFAGQDIKSGRNYQSASQAMSDARAVFFLLNGVSQLMNLNIER